MSAHKRKNRGGSVRAQRQRSIVTDGVYNNPAFMHAAASQVGNPARITTASGQVWEGIYKTYSTNFDVVLEVAVRVGNPDSPDSHLLTETFVEKLVFKSSDILNICFRNVDLEYPVKDTFQTDTAIAARLNGNKNEEKQLEPWDAGQINGTDNLSLDLDGSNGWDVNDMFRKNEQDYGVQSTFDHSLRGYTVPLQTGDSQDYREAQAKADQIANEIENQPTHKARLDLENGDEEEAFAAVVRPNQQESNGKYIPPAKRKGQNNGKLVRSTPPPSSGSSSQNSPSPKETRPPVSYPTHNNPHPSHQNSVHNLPSHTPQPQNQMPHVSPSQHIHNVVPQGVPPQIQQSLGPQHQQNMSIQSHPPPPQSQPGRPNSHTPPHQYQQGPPPRQPPGGSHGMPHNGPPHNKPQLNNEPKSGPQQRQQRHQQYQAQQHERIAPPIQSPSPLQSNYQDIKPQDSPPVVHQVPTQQPLNHPPPPRQSAPPARHEPPPSHPQNQETIKDFQTFSQDFKLAPIPQQNSNIIPITSPHAPPQGGGPPNLGPQAQHIPGGAESPQIPPPQHIGTGGSPNMAASGPNSSGSSSNSNSSLNMINPIEQNQPGGPNNKQPSPAQSPASIESEKLQNTIAKSKLNPNAKEFVLNPTAKPFQPRSPSTPSASRPHTPQTPSHSPYMPQTVSGPGAPQMPAVMMHMPYIGISQAQYQPPPPQTNRIRKIPMGQIRTDMASQMQHAAAVTGQPLLAPAPLPQFIYNPSAAAAAHGMNQAAYQQAGMAAMHATLRMYNDATVAAAAPPQIQYLPPQQSGSGSPAQPYNPAAVQQQQGPQQGYQAAPPPQGPPQMPMFCIPTNAHMLPSVPAYLQQAPPPPPPHQHVQVLVQHQHPGTQGGNPHGPNP
ncbi:ataxin-2 homolog isoform X1 [Sitophilus oryzae]|uniref:Ataxin-2 homolog isoform X1 n=2 Tax=Sitophilus oryzae TaxID=7048 RepID=A0A6J2Y3I0_SITOR|nr:ataxin-2 homolog isoform X1 [Sitophilus oryzae]